MATQILWLPKWNFGNERMQYTFSGTGIVATLDSLAAGPTSNQWINSISAAGVPSLSQPAFTNISGTLAGNQLPTHIVGAGSAPSFVAGTGAGTSPTITFTTGSTDNCGQINVTTGSTPAATAVIVTITFAVAFGSNAFVVLEDASGVTGLLSGAANAFVGSAPNTANFTINSGATNLTGATAYKWNYLVMASS